MKIRIDGRNNFNNNPEFSIMMYMLTKPSTIVNQSLIRLIGLNSIVMKV